MVLTVLFGWQRDTFSSFSTLNSKMLYCVQVLQQEEQADKDWALDKAVVLGGPRPRCLRQKWQEAIEQVADASLPLSSDYVTGDLARFLERLRAQIVNDLVAATRNVVSIYPEEYQPFQVTPSPLGDLLTLP